ncbi:hypothetical protein CAEBREN_08727 [Caenorhabditis brenneri]|uniref:BTB domain-containing protein n=1 Tax=Caenorhabditis brenneri TaxID=135651 RepID=G0MUW7_CAEBE|nr:hypothetical protein CAEBREN_08727 [Caenorhabditis brenneri]
MQRQRVKSEDDDQPPPAKKLRYFNDPTQSRANRWDRIVIVEGQKFHVIAAHLAQHSDMFDGLFFGAFAEKDQKEVTLNDPVITAEDFQYFLEATNGELTINDSNVNSVMHLADIWGATTVRKQCEKFLMMETKKATKEKLEIAKQYGMDELVKKAVSEIKSMKEIIELVPDRKSLELLEKPMLEMLLTQALRFPFPGCVLSNELMK